MFYGLDVHKEFLQVCALGDDGQERRDFRVGGRPEAVEAFARGLKRSDRVALEATFHTWALVQILGRYVDRVVVAEPAQLKAIAYARIKTDKVDAHILAQLLRRGITGSCGFARSTSPRPSSALAARATP